MPYAYRYEAVRLKRLVCRNEPFWPYLSEALTLKLYNGVMYRGFNASRVIDEIALLEGATSSRQTNTKPATQFKGPHLGRFWHKHWTDSAFINKNLDIHWFGPHAEKKELLKREIEKACKTLGKDSVDDLVEDEIQGLASLVSHSVVHNGYASRRARNALTGEWLIYYIHNGQNYYLDIAVHCSRQDEPALLERLRASCEWEFPFAFS
ncbi:Uncharacterised protein [Pseudomonas luteola]|uniref:Uncharacterized protein n=2 Tax=Pseudomonas TaxID=286 RepID=A0A2X2C8Y2_PSELU|nr:hypothetical protein SAMN05216409_114102 [Pseudomonas lutea]SPZ04982.1 Uncharacterised protein [Pseudomonas luteola]